MIHTSCLMDRYQSQQQRRLRPSRPFCRAEPPMTDLEDSAKRPERVPPPERRQFNWVAAHRHNAYLHYAWNERVSAERDAFFLQFIHETMPENVILIRADSRMYLVTNYRDENRGISRFLAQNKREAVQRFRFVLENILAIA